MSAGAGTSHTKAQLIVPGQLLEAGDASMSQDSLF